MLTDRCTSVFLPLTHALVCLSQELNIWRHWIERKRLASSLSYRVPLSGLSAKQLLADEWMRASTAQKREILTRLGTATANHCRSLSTGHASGARPALASLTAVLTALHDYAQDDEAMSAVPVDRCFSCSFIETLASPQASVLKLILAEQLQAQCSLLLSERLALEDERASAQQTSLRATGSADIPKPTNHTQRRRANRKKLLKKRRHDAEERVAQQQLLKTVLDELRSYMRKRRDAAKRVVSEILSDIVTSAATAAKPKAPKPQNTGASGQTVVSLLEASSASAAAAKKKTKKKRKKSGSTSSVKKSESDVKRSSKDAVSDKRALASPDASSSSPLLHGAALKPATTLLVAPSELDPVDLDEKENVAVASAQRLDDSSSGSSPDARPLLSFLDKSYASPLSLPTFGPQPLYTPSSPSSPPFFLSLAPRELTSGRDRSRMRRDDLVAGDDRTSTESAASSNNSSSHSSSNSHSRQPKASAFEWYLPSLFSSEASNHTNSTTSSLDWDFHNWQLKNDASSSSSTTTTTATATAAMAKTSKSSNAHGSSTARSGLRSSAHATANAATSSPAQVTGVEASLASPSKTYSLESFSSLLRVDAPRPRVASVHDVTDRCHDSVAAAADACETTDESAVGGVQSDFLYRQGGFFDRQRALKRRRRPLPFDYDGDSDSERDGERDGEANQVEDDDVVWGEYPRRCCECLCHEASGDAKAACACASNTVAPQPPQDSDALPVAQNERSSETAAMLERLTALEAALEAKTQVRVCVVAACRC